DVTIGADIFADALVAAIAVADEVRRDGYEIATSRDDSDIGNQPARARVRVFGVALRAHQPLDALADAHNVVGEDEQRRLGIAFGVIVRRHVIARVVGQ